MLSDRDWVRLIQGLVRATNERRLEWQGEGFNDAYSVFSSLSKLSSYVGGITAGRTSFTAVRKDASYEISAASGGLAPHLLKVWVRDGDQMKEVGSIESSVNARAMVTGINDSLKELWTAAAATVEAGEVIVDRLLQDLDG